MLSDIERKMLRILHNYSVSHHRMPPLYLLLAKTGRREGGVVRALKGLANKGYIEWSLDQSVEEVVILQAWEDEARMPKSDPSRQQKQWWEYLV